MLSQILSCPAIAPAPNVINVGASTQTAITTAINNAIAAGGGILVYPNGGLPLGYSVPLVPGVKIHHIGLEPSVLYLAGIPDDTFIFQSGKGTILTGNGTFPGFRPGLNDGLTYFDDSPVTLATLNAGTDRATFTYDPNWQTGVAVWFQTTGNGFTAGVPGSSTNRYYLFRVSANLYEFYTTRAHAIAGSGASKVDVTGTVVATNGYVTPNQVYTTCPKGFYTTTTNGTTSIILAAGKGADFTVGQTVTFDTSATSTLTPDRIYYVKTISTDTITVSLTSGGSAVSVGNGNPTMRRGEAGAPYSTTTNGTTSIVLGPVAGLGVDFVVGQGVTFRATTTGATTTASGTLNTGQTYYILTISTDTITIGLTPGGAPITVGAGNPNMSPWTANQVTGVTISGFGFGGTQATGFTRAVSWGAKNVAGPLHSTIEKLWIRDCVASGGGWSADRWALNIENDHHLWLDWIRTYNCANGVRLAGTINWATCQMGNGKVGNLVFMNNEMPTGDRRKFQALLVEAKYDQTYDQKQFIGRIQSTGKFGITEMFFGSGGGGGGTGSVSVTNASTSVTVPDTTVFELGMPLRFVDLSTSTATDGTNSLTINQQCFVLSMIDATHMTVGYSMDIGTPFTFTTSNSNLAIKSVGVPTGTFRGNNSEAGASISKITDCLGLGLDLEGYGFVYFGNVQDSVWQVGSFGNGSLGQPHLVCRNDSNQALNDFCCFSTNVIMDFDSRSATSQFRGLRDTGNSVGSLPVGVWRDENNNVVINCAANTETLRYRNMAGGGYLKPGLPIGSRYTPWPYSAASLGNNDGGTVVAYGSGATTIALPAIDSSGGVGDNLGVKARIMNQRTGILTVNSGNSELMNGLAGKTSAALAAQTATATAYLDYELQLVNGVKQYLVTTGTVTL